MSFWDRLRRRTPESHQIAESVEIEKKAPQGASPMSTLGAPGFSFFDGRIVERESNDTLLGRQKWTTYQNLLTNVHIIAAGARYLLNLVSGPSWRWDPPNESSEAQKIADQVQEAFEGMRTPWRRVVRRASLYRLFGYSVHEWTAKRMEDGWIGLDNLRARPCHTINRWELDDHTGDVMGVWQLNPRTGIEVHIPRWKCLYVVDDTLTDMPEGLGALRHCVEPAHYLKRYEQLEGYGYDTNLRGIPFFRVPMLELSQLVKSSQLTPAQKEEILQPIKDFMNGHVRNAQTALMLDSSTYQTATGDPTPEKRYDMELVKGDITGEEPLSNTIVRKTFELARILGVESILLGGDTRGSFALAKEMGKSLKIVVDGSLSDIGESVRADLIVNGLAKLNNWPEKLLPRPKIDKLKLSDLEPIVAALTGLAQAGALMQPNDPAVNAVRDMAGLPDQPVVDDEVDAGLVGRKSSDPRKPKKDAAEVGNSTVDD